MTNTNITEKILHNSQYQWPNWLEVTKTYNFNRLQERGDIVDVSFIFTLDQVSFIIFYGFASNIEEMVIDVPCILLESGKKLSNNAYKEFIKKLNEDVLQKYKNFFYRDFLIDGNISIISQYLLLKGYSPKSKFIRVIDLKNDENYIRKDIRKSYKTKINWGNRELDPKIFNSNNITWHVVNLFRLLHIRESGKEVRSKDTWKRQFEMIKSNEAFIVCGYYDNNMITAGFFSYSMKTCLYQVSASRRDLFDKPLFHSIMWNAIIHAKKLGCEQFEVGEEILENKNQACTEKERQISYFKGGFGGDIKMYLDFKSNRG